VFVAIQLIISEPMPHYPVWIHCCKRPNYDFWISQGSLATVLRWDRFHYIFYVKFLSDVTCETLSKSVNVSRSYSKNKSSTFFYWDTVY